MSGFIERLESLSSNDTRVRAVLRRSLAFEPGTFVQAFPYVEPFVKEDDSKRREVHYLVAGLWASHWREGRGGKALRLGEACASHPSTSIERRFIALLNADFQQLPHHLRQMISLLKEQTIDFQDLLNGLIYWDHDLKRTQNAWARDFYRTRDDE